uniref:Beta-galactosidase n=1 Tax=Angiostrongylus cantonensis TaxID=6313 RepID=A0A0K0CXB3_ANGCA
MVHGQTGVDKNADSFIVAYSEEHFFFGVRDGVEWVASSRLGQTDDGYSHWYKLINKCLIIQRSQESTKLEVSMNGMVLSIEELRYGKHRVYDGLPVTAMEKANTQLPKPSAEYIAILETWWQLNGYLTYTSCSGQPICLISVAYLEDKYGNNCPSGKMKRLVISRSGIEP